MVMVCTPLPRCGVGLGSAVSYASGEAVGSGEAAGVCDGDSVSAGGVGLLLSCVSSPRSVQAGMDLTSSVTELASSTTHSAVSSMFLQFGFLLCGLFLV